MPTHARAMHAQRYRPDDLAEMKPETENCAAGKNVWQVTRKCLHTPNCDGCTVKVKFSRTAEQVRAKKLQVTIMGSHVPPGKTFTFHRGPRHRATSARAQACWRGAVGEPVTAMDG
jgi:hypothetical protein